MNGVRGLLTPDILGGVVATARDNNPGMDENTALRIVSEALKFVDAAAKFPRLRITPSRVVDEGWHALILHTDPYAKLCARLGRFVHHYPERPDPSRHDPLAMTRTVALIEKAGHSVDGELWAGPTRTLASVAANCSHTPMPGGCGPIRPGNCASHCSDDS
ncbi:glycine-rich domain-containing protein [Streptomyces sp. NBC_00648]|uniref:glycine-rich domain-containing protein n=1 Tax=Streptomyces sp. NBC_00648 TaxID=2975797 RepID=UPI00324F4B87